MYLKRLEIFGFKSFAEKTVLNFEPGITAVVGPNGCGKSNIFDSMRWVLGEQSIKELRGSAMEDVIFNGTDSKAGLGFAEVNLTFSNESRMLPTDYDEVTVTRRLFRSGESEYLLNKTVVRLKDVLELFMGTGIGAEAYSLVQQGKVDLIVSARPEDRRIIIDEAAGITKYKSKKREALSKLQDTENNLLRINDIILEVKRQIASIERQANKARKYKEEFEKLKNLEIKLAKFQSSNFFSQVDEITKLLEFLKTQEAEQNQELEKLNQLLTAENNVALDLDQKISGVHGDDMKLENQIEMDIRQTGFNDERISGLAQSDERLAAQKSQLMERCRMQEEKISSLKSALAQLRETMERNCRALAEKKESLVTVGDEIRRAKEGIEEDEEHVLDLTAKQINIKNDQTEVMKEFQGFLARKRRLDLENDKVTQEKSDIDSRLIGINDNIASCLGKITDLKKEQETKNLVIGGLKANLSVVEKAIDDLEKKKLFLKSQREFIEELRVQYQDLSDPVLEATFLAMIPLEKNKGIIGKIRDVRPLDPQKVAAVRSHFPQLQSEQLYEIICETKSIELDPQKITEKIDTLTREIDMQVLSRDGFLLEIKREEDVANSITLTIHDLEKVMSSYEAQKNNIVEEVNKLTGELDLVSSELREARSAMATLKNKEDELNKKLAVVDEEVHGVQRQVKDKQGLIVSKSQEREDVTVVIAQLEKEIELSEDNEKGQHENLKIFEEAVVSGLAEIKQVDSEVAENQVKKQDITKEIESIKLKIEEYRAKRQSLQGIVDGYEKEKAEVALRVSEIQGNSASIFKKLEEIKKNVHAQEMHHQEISFNDKSIKDRLTQTYKINLDEVVLEAREEIKVDELINEIEQLRKRCDSFGQVNLVAIDEFDELKQRFEFLAKQQSDLLTAKEALHSTIGKINRTTRQLFLDTFTKVSEEFRIYFRMLFGGGEAQLVLVDPENVLESGIEIIARPPGKKLQNITLLSGGEKTLAAIALIFGVFKVRPSPFCVLDEIDAALDESNVGRFSYLLKDFAKISQFIVITHNKKTIANADVMYGITMQETGVSKIVSVKFAQSKEEVKQEVPAGV